MLCRASSAVFETVAAAPCCGDLATTVGSAAASPLSLLKSPRQTIQVSDIQENLSGDFERSAGSERLMGTTNSDSLALMMLGGKRRWKVDAPQKAV